MKFITCLYEKKEIPGILFEEKQLFLPFSEAGYPCSDMNDFILKFGSLPNSFPSIRAEYFNFGCIPLSEVKILSPIPRPLQDVICLGINYMHHAEEAGKFHAEAFGGEIPKTIYFSKRVNEAPGPGGCVPAHANLVDSLDYEAELAVIIGRDTYNVKKEEAEEYIFGYTVLNDISARNVQTGHRQWYFGKSLDGFTPMGPCILTKDETSFPPALRISSYVNGELRQNSTTSLLIHGIAEIIEELSSGMTLKAGTIIATGTPEGVGMGFTPPRFLKPGDTVDCRIEGIGSLENTITD